ncbi:lipopolysaccharide biosynthesis protein [Microvirga soli]|uniref:lipopolysaccharide biosynthesis protein n=1 Tax=Microvirga soli TaxID=1854496 RepID=UPI0019203239|nr:lipopolysaccharide biosynthesis protein [Microvirga soli]
MQGKQKKALFWLLVEVLGAQGIPFVVFLVIARIIGPKEYGAFTLAITFVSVLNIIIFQGVAEALIRLEEPEERYKSTAFWMNLTLAFGIFAAVQLLAGPIANIFGAPVIEHVLRWIALLGPLQAMISIQGALFRRDLNMEVLARRTLAGRTLGALIGIGMAIIGWGIWSLVAVQLVQAVVSIIVVWIASSWRPRLIFDRGCCRELTHFGGQFISASLATSLSSRVDGLLVGFFFGAHAAGYYALGSRIMEMVITVLLTPMRALVMPVLSRVASNKEDFAEAYSEMVTLSYVVWTPAILTLGAAAKFLIPTFFGSEWALTTDVLEAMSLAAFTLPLWYFAGQALTALGKTSMFLHLAAAQVVLVTLCIIVGAQFSLVGVGLAWSASSALLVPLCLFMLQKASGLSWRSGVLPGLRIGGAGLGFMGCVIAVELWASYHNWSTLMSSSVGIGLGLIVYLALLEFVLLRGYVSTIVRNGREFVSQLKRSPERIVSTSQ